MKALKLSDLVQEMDFQMDEVTIYYDLKKNCFYHHRPDYVELQYGYEDEEDLDFESEIHTDRFRAIPDQYEIHEYRMMEKFSLRVGGPAGDDLYRAIKGSGAFRYFKDTLYRHDLQERWYDYKYQCYADVARGWCECSGIKFVDDIEAKDVFAEVEKTEDEIDWDKVDEAALALMYLTTRDEGSGDFHCYRTWKSFDWDVTNRLHEKGYIADPKSKAKSFRMTDEGYELSRQLFDRLFAKD